MELSTMITGAQQQRNATATQFDSSDFLVRRLEEYEGTFIVLTTRIEESYAQEINLRIQDGYGLFEESATQHIVMITRNGEVGRPRLALAREQLETLQGTLVFQLSRDIVARSRCQVTGVSSRLS